MRPSFLVRATFVTTALVSAPAFAQPPQPGQPSQPDKGSTKAPGGKAVGSGAAEGAPAGMDPKQAAAMEKMMQAWQAFATPGPEHQKLKALTGTWNAAVKMWMDPKAPPQDSTGTATTKMILADHYLQQEFTGNMMGQAFNGWNIIGYDNGRKKWLTFWIDSMGTGFFTGEGTADAAGKVITFETQATDPMTKKTAKGRQIFRLESDTRMTVEMFDKKAGKDVKMMEIVYTKK